jgi:hypothetical protein
LAPAEFERDRDQRDTWSPVRLTRVGVELGVQAESADGLREKKQGSSQRGRPLLGRGRVKVVTKDGLVRVVDAEVHGIACWKARTGSMGVAVRCPRCGGCSGEAPQSHPRHGVRGGSEGGPLPAAVDRARQDLPGRRSVGQVPRTPYWLLHRVRREQFGDEVMRTGGVSYRNQLTVMLQNTLAL